MAAGIDMIPAPTTLVDTLNTAPTTDADEPPACSGRSGASSAVTLSEPGLLTAEDGGFLDLDAAMV
jgi:hypothetical protein